MNIPVKISLWEKEVAVIVWDSKKEYAVIEFLESIVRDKLDLAPLTMPYADLVRGERIFSFPTLSSKTFKGLPGLIADSLPDDYGNSVIDAWFASHGMSVSITPLDRLCYIGKRGMGALEYEPTIADNVLNESSRLEIPALVALADEVLNKRRVFHAELERNEKEIIDVLKVGTSAGGAKPKAIIAFNKKTKEVRSGQVKAPEGFTYWILKFDGMEGGMIKDNPTGIGRIEYAYHKMAVDCGIQMTECQLLHENDKAHFMTKRFDRSDNGDKFHTQTFCAMAHYDRDDRYSYEQLFRIMRQLHLPYSDMEQMYRRMVFNVIAFNHDDHTKNHSFIMNREGEWSLAPAYDLCYSYSPSGKWTNQHQLSLNGKRDNFTQDDLITVGKKTDIRNVTDIIEHITEVVAQWTTYAKMADVNKDHSKQIEDTLQKSFVKRLWVRSEGKSYSKSCTHIF